MKKSALVNIYTLYTHSNNISEQAAGSENNNNNNIEKIVIVN